MINEQYKYSELTSKIIGCAMAVHKALGNGFQERMPISYRNLSIGSRRVDFLVEEKISVELKALNKLEDVHLAQAINYLEAYNLEIGLLINFGCTSLQFHRLVNKKFKSP